MYAEYICLDAGCVYMWWAMLYQPWIEVSCNSQEVFPFWNPFEKFKQLRQEKTITFKKCTNIGISVSSGHCQVTTIDTDQWYLQHLYMILTIWIGQRSIVNYVTSHQYLVFLLCQQGKPFHLVYIWTGLFSWSYKIIMEYWLGLQQEK